MLEQRSRYAEPMENSEVDEYTMRTQINCRCT